LANVVKLYKQHLHQLGIIIDDIGNKLKKLKVQVGFHFSIDRAVAQFISDTNKFWAVVAIFERVINSAFDKHIKDTAAANKFHYFIHQTSNLYKLETSFIHCPEEQTFILIIYVPFVETENLLPLYKFISILIYFNFSSNVSVIPDFGKSDFIITANTEAFQTLSTSDLPNCNCLGQTFSVRVAPSSK
jgi:hypothetical protein